MNFTIEKINFVSTKKWNNNKTKGEFYNLYIGDSKEESTYEEVSKDDIITLRELIDTALNEHKEKGGEV